VFKQLCPSETVPKNWNIKKRFQKSVKQESFKKLYTLYYKVAEGNVGWVVLGFG